VTARSTTSEETRMSTIAVTDRRAPAPTPPTGKARLYTALAAFQAALPHIGADNKATVHGETKSGKPTQYTYNYANLGDIAPLVMPLLAQHGLAFTAKPTMDGGSFLLIYKLTHSSGEEDGGVYPLPDPTRTDPQKLGGAITYARRYTLCAMTGIAPGKDDDDAQSSRSQPAATAPKSDADKAREEVAAVMDAQQLDPAQVVRGYYRRHKVDLRKDENATNLRAFAAALRQDPDAALAVDPATGEPSPETEAAPTRPRAVS
jgi:hypothetical protein